MIIIKSLRTSQMKELWDVRVDRRSVLGNPFYMASEADRNKVCDQYQVYFEAKANDINSPFRTELNRLFMLLTKYGKLNLFCWCAPKRCHAETIKKFLELMVVAVRNGAKI